MLTGLTQAQYEQLRVSSALLQTGLLFFVELLKAGSFAIMEHPAEAYWCPSAPSIWKLGIMRILRKCQAVQVWRFNQSVHGQVSEKPTNLLTLRLPTISNYIYANQLQQSVTNDVAPQPLIGKDSLGRWRTAQAKEYIYIPRPYVHLSLWLSTMFFKVEGQPERQLMAKILRTGP